MISSSAVMIITLECVTVHKPDLGILIDRYTATALSAQTILIFSIHDFLTEIALINVKISRVE